MTHNPEQTGNTGIKGLFINEGRLAPAINVAQPLIVTLLLGFFILNFAVVFEIDVWRHDAIYNTNDYFYKLQTEGRWVNYLLWPFLRLINPYVSIFLTCCSTTYFLYIAANKVVNSPSYALVVALVGLQTPFLFVLFGWPTTPLPAFLALGLSAFLANKIPLHWFLLLFAIIFFGTLSKLFFLMPLLFISNITFRKSVRLVVLWMITFVLGYIAAQIMTYLNSFEFFQLADWRQPHYMQSGGDLIANIMKVYNDFLVHNKQIMDMARVNWAIASLLAIVFVLKLKTDAISILVCFIAGIAVFVTVIPAGLNITPRTVFTYWVCLVFIFLAREKWTDFEKVLTLGLALAIGINMALAGNQVLT